MNRFLSPLWFMAYALGAILCVSVVGYATSVEAAITLAGFLIVFGTLGFEYLTREKIQGEIFEELAEQKTTQDSILSNLAETEKTIEDIQKTMRDMRASSLNKSVAQKPQAPNTRSNFIPPTKAIANPSGLTPNRPTISPQTYADMLERKTPLPRMSDENAPPVKTEPPPPQFTESVIRELVQNAVTHDRIEMFAQPIVKLPSRKIHSLEVFARIRARAGIYVPASQYRKMAVEQDLLVEVDRILLQNVLDSVKVNKKRDLNMNYFINISTTTLKDFQFMSRLLEFLRSDRDLAPFLIFEFRHVEFEALNDQVKALLKGLAKTGCKFSVDNVTDTQLDFDTFRALNVRFVKMDSHQLIGLLEEESGTERMHKLKKRLDAEDITLIVEKIEDEREVRELLDFEIDFGEGYLFGKPDLEIAYRPRKTA
jgi:cyclic-di-GMP phosphodiesterase TipF (flagellum assembly factor)